MSTPKTTWLCIIAASAIAVSLASFQRGRPSRASAAPDDADTPALPVQPVMHRRADATDTATTSASARLTAGAPSVSAVQEDPGAALLARALAASQLEPVVVIESQRDSTAPQSDPATSVPSASPPPLAAVLEAWEHGPEDPNATREIQTYLEETARAIALDPSTVSETDCRGDVCRASLVFPTLAAALDFQAAGNPAAGETVYVSRRGADTEPDGMRFDVLIRSAVAHTSDAPAD